MEVFILDKLKKEARKVFDWIPLTIWGILNYLIHAIIDARFRFYLPARFKSNSFREPW